VANDSFRQQARIASEQTLGDLSKLHVLGIRVRSFIRTLKFDAEGKVVATASTLILGFTCVPGSLVKGDKLNRLT